MEVRWSDFFGENSVSLWTKIKKLAGSKLAVNWQFDVTLDVIPLLLTAIGLFASHRLYAFLRRSKQVDEEVQTELEDIEDIEGPAEAGNPNLKLTDHQVHEEKKDDVDWENFDWDRDPVIHCSCPKSHVKHNLDLWSSAIHQNCSFLNLEFLA